MTRRGGGFPIDCSDSSCFSEAYWRAGQLYLTFWNGYQDIVPCDRTTAEDFAQADSLGSYYNQFLK